MTSSLVDEYFLRKTIPLSCVIGIVFNGIRKEKGLNQAQLAKIISTSQPSYAKMEKGIVIMSVVQLYAFADKLGVEFGEICKQTERIVKYCEEFGITVEKKRICTERKRRGEYLLGTDLSAFLTYHRVMPGTFDLRYAGGMKNG